MIKPSEKTFPNTINPNYERIERHIDECIAAATSYPVQVPSTRSGWRLSEIETVADKYRAAGWDVHVISRGGVTMTLSPSAVRVDGFTELP